MTGDDSFPSPAVDRSICTGCGDCVEICPTEALTAEPVPRVLGRLCVSCGACAGACGPGAVSFPPRVSI